MYEKDLIKVSVAIDDLLKILHDNRATHAADYQKAKTGFRKLLEQELEKKLEQVRSGKKVELTFKNKKPESHLSDYDEIIGMLELATDTTIPLTQTQYKNYVKDDWNWKASWVFNNSTYLSAA